MHCRIRALCLVLFSFCFTALADDVTTLTARYENLSLGGPVTAVANQVLSSGRLKLNLSRGFVAPVTAGDEVVGIFFKGEGTFEYTADDAVEIPVLKANLRYAKSRAAFTGEKTGKLTASFTDFLFAVAGAPRPALTGEPADVPLEESFRVNRSVFLENRALQYSFLLARQKLNAPSARLVRAEIRGDEEWVYTWDEVVAHSESLARQYSIDFEDRSRRRERYESPLSEIPIGRTRADVLPAPVTLTAMDYTVVANEGNVAISVRQTIVPRASGHRALWFMLYDVIRDARNNEHHLRVRSVAAGSKPVPFAHQEGELLVSLPEATTAGKAIELQFELAGDILLRPSGDNYWLLRGPWYPTPPQGGELATVHGVVKVRAPFTPFTGGTTISRRTEGDYNVLETKFDQPVEFVCIVAGKFHFEEQKRDGLTVRVASYAAKNTAAIRKLTNLAFDMIGYYEYFLGPFPFDELTIAEMNDYGWGQAPPGLVFVTQEAFQPLLGEMNQLYSEGINERIAHEIAHSYWGSGVKFPTYDEQWLSESFAEYSAALLLRKFKGDAVYRRLIAHWKGNARVANDTAPIPLANRITTPNNEDWQRVHLLYSKGPLLLAALHREVGDEAFLTFMKSCQKSFRWKYGATRDIAGLLGFITKKDFKPFFDAYYWGTEMPDVK